MSHQVGVSFDFDLSDTFPIQTYMKEGDVLSPLIFSFHLGYVIMAVAEDQEGFKLNAVRSSCSFIGVKGFMKTDTLLVANGQFGLHVNAERA